MKKIRIFGKLIFIGFLIFICAREVDATHIKAGQITASRDASNPFKYNFTLHLYCDSAAAPQVLAGVSPASFSFSDGGSVTNISSIAPPGTPGNLIYYGPKDGQGAYIGNSTIDFQFNFSYTFPSSGTFSVSYVQDNRNANIINMDNSVSTPFYLSTSIIINPFLGLNSAPVFTIPPIDVGCSNEPYLHNAGVYDPDGDSLAYRLYVPQQAAGVFVNNYRDPNNSSICPQYLSSCSTTSFSIDPYTGTLSWITPYFFPGVPGGKNLYNVAFIVEEWRHGILLSSTIRDMQIRILDCNNKPPVITVPKRLCVVGGQTISKNITVIDPNTNNRKLTFTYSGGPFNANPKASISATLIQPRNLIEHFLWNTQCSNVRSADYVAYFRATNNPVPGTPLTDIKTWNIKVVGPPPTGFKASPTTNGIRLSWNPYGTCSNLADSINIFRANGCQTFVRDTCNPNYHPNFYFLGSVSASDTVFIDKTAVEGNKYSYFANVSFTDGGGYSFVGLASKDTCIGLPITSPIITEVSVIKTDSLKGIINVKWVHPRQLDISSVQGPFGYLLYRQSNAANSKLQLITDTTFTSLSDTSYQDKLLNTLDNIYTYLVVLTYKGGIPLDSASPASSVRLKASGTPRGVSLTWFASVPWINSNQYHYIYRRIGNSYVLIDSVLTSTTGTYTYEDIGKYKNIPLVCIQQYHYYVTTKGSYNNPLIYDPLLNNSQEDFATPTDTVLPPPPTLTVKGPNCASFAEEEISNKLNWINNQSDNALTCRKIKYYKVYYAEHEGSNLNYLVSTTDTFYTHLGTPFNLCQSAGGAASPINSLAGCYAVTAVDSVNIESNKSNIVCVDNCIKYDLPNIFSPNGDKTNELFQPLNPIRYAYCVNLNIYNRWGAKIATLNGDINLEWPGKIGNSNVPDGMYFYEGNVYFKRLSNTPNQEYKGYFQIIR